MPFADRIRALAALLKDRPWATWLGYPAFFSLAFFARPLMVRSRISSRLIIARRKTVKRPRR